MKHESKLSKLPSNFAPIGRSNFICNCYNPTVQFHFQLAKSSRQSPNPWRFFKNQEPVHHWHHKCLPVWERYFRKAAFIKDNNELRNEKTQIDQANVVSATQIANQLAMVGVNLAGIQLGVSTEINDLVYDTHKSSLWPGIHELSDKD
ncbi:hypothetical protein DM860_007570 [Cuscuta australis]|uniref:Uncharacterized protein n=1 Tax=Cuscuta australis TaxID=267555 RepID=A0A328E477_9ASTE|nr:hypothetical protein DM860_007570 [Cuscuta australis]